MIEWDAVFYSVPPEAVGQMVEARQPVATRVLELRLAGRLVAVHRARRGRARNRSGCPSTAPRPKRSRSAATDATCARSPISTMATVVAAAVLELGDGDYDVEEPDLGHVRLDRPAPR